MTTAIEIMPISDIMSSNACRSHLTNHRTSELPSPGLRTIAPGWHDLLGVEALANDLPIEDICESIHKNVYAQAGI